MAERKKSCCLFRQINVFRVEIMAHGKGNTKKNLTELNKL